MVNEKIMTDRSLIVLALDALDELNYSNSTESAKYQYYEATKLLRAAIEQPQAEQEPVAWINPSALEWINPSALEWINPSALEWITRESEKLVKLTRKAQPEYDFTEPLYTCPQPAQQPEWPNLDKPARVGGGLFGVGVTARYVVAAAQRAHAEQIRVAGLTHEQLVEEERRRRKLWDLVHGPIDDVQPAQHPLTESETCKACGEGKARISVTRVCDTCGSEYAGQAEMGMAKRIEAEQQAKPVAGVVLRDGLPTLLRDRDIKATDVRLYARPQQTEPVAFSTPGAIEFAHRQSEVVVKLTRKQQPRCGLTIPLYTRPQPPRQPLTDEQIFDACESTGWIVSHGFAIDLARGIEAAHGIKEQK